MASYNDLQRKSVEATGTKVASCGIWETQIKWSWIGHHLEKHAWSLQLQCHLSQAHFKHFLWFSSVLLSCYLGEVLCDDPNLTTVKETTGFQAISHNRYSGYTASRVILWNPGASESKSWWRKIEFSSPIFFTHFSFCLPKSLQGWASFISLISAALNLGWVRSCLQGSYAHCPEQWLLIKPT